MSLNKQYKGFLFIGCSFTWGQGLYFYSNLESVKEPLPNTFDMSIISEGQLRFMYANRFPRLIANHYNTFELVIDSNGGGDTGNCDYWMNKLGKNLIYPFSDYSNIVFQLSQPHRNWTTFEYEGKKYKFNVFAEGEKDYDKNLNTFTKWLESNNMDIDSWNILHVKQSLEYVKQTLMYFEEQGIDTNIMTWTDDYIDHILNDNWLRKRFIRLHHDGIVFNSINSLMLLPEMKISTDVDNLANPPIDDHPSLKCHQVISESIIRKLENTVI